MSPRTRGPINSATLRMPVFTQGEGPLGAEALVQQHRQLDQQVCH
jgi:hypothetical protein